MTLGLVILGPLLAGATFFALGPFNQSAGSPYLRLILLADIVYILVVAALVLARVARMISDRRSQSAGSRLHMRLTGVFALVALTPTVLVAVFAVLTVNIGLEGWFSDRVQKVVGNSLAAAQAYEGEHEKDLTEDAKAFAAYLNVAKQSTFFLQDDQLRPLLTQTQSQIQRGLKEAFLIDGAGLLKTRGAKSYLFDFEQPSPDAIERAQTGEVVIIQDWTNNEFRALVHLEAYADRYLYISRTVDGAILSLLDETKETVRLYQQVEAARGRLLFEFGLIYIGFALILILAAIWLGLWFASRLSRPIGLLAQATDRVGRGDLDVQVPEVRTGDEIQTLGQAFNRMTRQLKTQREELVESYRLSDDQRRLFDNVLTSVTSGVIGLDAAGEIDFVNRSASRLLGLDAKRDIDALLSEVVPEFAPLFARLSASVAETIQDEVRLMREGRIESLLVRMAVRRGTDGALEGYVVAFDDVTELVSAQRMAAWGDVARRVAHEIKNPLTPIQLSAERLRRKFGPLAAEGDRAALEQYTDVIIRQTNDLRRIVDEFSRFARMPEPDRAETDLAALLRQVLLLQQDALHATITRDIPDDPVIVDCDAGMMRQALTNLLKNAGEAIDEQAAQDIPGWTPQIAVALEVQPESVCIRITDTGPGLPADRSRLFEPYVTLKSHGTGLGLPIVKKIVEEHGGSLSLTDAPDPPGAMAEIRLPRERHPVRAPKTKSRQEKDEATP